MLQKLNLLYELNNLSYVNNMSYVNNLSYVNNMIYVKLYELRHELCKLYKYFYESIKTKQFFNLRHQKYII